MIEKRLKDAAYATPDPERALKNLSSFLSENPSRSDELEENVRNISLLFSCSQFLANYCISNPDILFETLGKIDFPPDKETLSSALKENLENTGKASSRPLQASSHLSLDPYMTAVREFRLKEILGIAIRDILKKVDLLETMLELSCLADAIIENSLSLVQKSIGEVYGCPENDAFSVISLGKLGGEELNFSSDVDLVYVYGTETGETAGVKTGQGIIKNRISNHEYYCKIGEALTRFLSLNTDAGFAYRVDLRLRPEGRRGAISMSLRGYEMYYESWGRAWERAMLIRARPVAGDSELGGNFLETIRPFVYRKYLDFSSIDEISGLKTRIDSTFKKDDIKRGYGGIREIEFFAQALQLIYGGREPLLRERSVLKALHRLLQKALVGQEDYSILTDNYRYLRTLEHRLQQFNDLQTHTLPSGRSELEALSKKMGFYDKKTFTADLEKRRAGVRNIYDSLFAEKREALPVSGTFFDEELSDTELRGYLLNTGLKDIDKAVRSIKSIKDTTLTYQTLRGRRLLGEILPLFVDSALRSNIPDPALNTLQSFAGLLSANESYLEIFRRNKGLIDMLIYVFSQSEYLSKMLIGRPKYLEMIGWEEFSGKTLTALHDEIKAGISGGSSVNDVIRLIKQTEEIRLGLLFLQKKIGVIEVIKGLSKTAEAVLSACLSHLTDGIENIAVIGLGKLGGREISFSSDLDLIFVSTEEVGQEDTKAAERLLRMLISYTKEGVAYRVDTRLRPEGSKGPLVCSIESFKKYYSKAAAFWEFQALLKARPVTGDIGTGLSFINMAKDTLMERGREISASDIKQMRGRILRELSRESEGYDIKLGPGGLEEVEFTVQYLQLINCRRHDKLLVQGALTAINRLGDSGVISKAEKAFLKATYLFYRTLEGFLRLRGENILRREEDKLRNASEFMGFKGRDEFVEHLEEKRKAVTAITERYLSGQQAGS